MAIVTRIHTPNAAGNVRVALAEIDFGLAAPIDMFVEDWDTVSQAVVGPHDFTGADEAGLALTFAALGANGNPTGSTLLSVSGIFVDRVGGVIQWDITNTNTTTLGTFSIQEGWLGARHTDSLGKLLILGKGRWFGSPYAL